MASASSSAQAAFGLGRRKKAPGLLDQIGNFFGGDKKRKSKVRKQGESISVQSADSLPEPLFTSDSLTDLVRICCNIFVI